jgi:hypothetical protein
MDPQVIERFQAFVTQLVNSVPAHQRDNSRDVLRFRLAQWIFARTQSSAEWTFLLLNMSPEQRGLIGAIHQVSHVLHWLLTRHVRDGLLLFVGFTFFRDAYTFFHRWCAS